MPNVSIVAVTSPSMEWTKPGSLSSAPVHSSPAASKSCFAARALAMPNRLYLYMSTIPTYQMAMLSSPKPTTVRPITAPLRNATRRAPSSECRAWLAARAEERVAVFMPSQPQSPLKKPPARKANGMNGFCTPRNARTTKTPQRTANTIATVLYCLFR